MSCWAEVVSAVGHHFATHAEAYGVGGAAVGISAIRNMPKPEELKPIIGEGSIFILYSWVYNTLQSALPIPRGTTQVPPTQPVPTPAPK